MSFSSTVKVVFYLIALLMIMGASCDREVPTMKAPFTPIEPIDFVGKIPVFDPSSGSVQSLPLLKVNDSIRRRFLTNEEIHITVQQLMANGEFEVVPVKASSKNEVYKVTIDYGKFRHIDIVDTINSTKCGIARIGVGLRVIVNYFNTTNNAEITNLNAISASLQVSKMSATFTASVLGLESKDITSSFPIMSEVNPTSVQQIVAAMTTIKSKIYDKETQVFPQIIAVKKDTSSSNCIKIGTRLLKNPYYIFTARTSEEFDQHSIVSNSLFNLSSDNSNLAYSKILEGGSQMPGYLMSKDDFSTSLRPASYEYDWDINKNLDDNFQSEALSFYEKANIITNNHFADSLLRSLTKKRDSILGKNLIDSLNREYLQLDSLKMDSLIIDDK